jgi:hypothetical protein
MLDPYQSPLCRERAAHAETERKRFALSVKLLAAELALTRKNADHANTQKRVKHAISQCDFWEKRCDEKDAEIKREREKWEKLREWACANFHFDEDPLLEMNRLDAEAKEVGK